MATKRPVTAADAPPRVKPTNYPTPFAAIMDGRTKQPLGDLFGLTAYGVNRTTLAPGAASALFHAHTGQDEFVYILSGHAMLRTPDGETPMRAGDCIGFAAGGGAHQLINRSEGEVVFLEVGDRRTGDTVSYPDDDLQAVMGADGNWRYTSKDGTPW